MLWQTGVEKRPVVFIVIIYVFLFVSIGSFIMSVINHVTKETTIGSILAMVQSITYMPLQAAITVFFFLYAVRFFARIRIKEELSAATYGAIISLFLISLAGLASFFLISIANNLYLRPTSPNSVPIWTFFYMAGYARITVKVCVVLLLLSIKKPMIKERFGHVERGSGKGKGKNDEDWGRSESNASMEVTDWEKLREEARMRLEKG